MRTKRIYNDLILQKSSKRLWLYVNLTLTTSSLKKVNKFINLKLSILCLKGQCHAYFNHISQLSRVTENTEIFSLGLSTAC